MEKSLLSPDINGQGVHIEISQTSKLVNLKQRRYMKETVLKTSRVELVVKNMPANAGDVRYVGSIPGLGRSPGVGNSNPL